MYDALIIGGGPAGLSAAVYLGRFTRSVLVLDAGEGRSSFSQVNENYLGFPEGVTTKELRELGRRQAERFGAEFKECQVLRIERCGQQDDQSPDACSAQAAFRVYTNAGAFEGRTLLFATGVKDIWPDVPHSHPWIGRQLFWCITCDGHRTLGKRLVCIGNTDEAATTTLQFLLFTKDITLVADPDKARFSQQKLADLAKENIAVHYARPQHFELSPEADRVTAVCLDDGTRLDCDLIFSLLGVRPNTQLAREMGVALDEMGYIEIDEEGYTNLPGVFAAGDLTRMYTQQVASAVHAGAEAAQTMNYFLYAPHQKNLEDASPQEARGADPENQ